MISQALIDLFYWFLSIIYNFEIQGNFKGNEKPATQICEFVLPRVSPSPLAANRTSAFRNIAERLAALDASDNEARASIARLNHTAAEENDFANDLATIEAAEAAAMRKWANKGEGDPPQPMTAEREALDAKYAAVRQRAAAARAALPGYQSQVQANDADRKALAREAEQAVFARLQADFAPAFAELATALERAKAARIAVNGIVESAFALGRHCYKTDEGAGRPILIWAEEKSRLLTDAIARADSPPADARIAYFEEVERGKRDLVERIAKDSAGLVQLEGA